MTTTNMLSCRCEFKQNDTNIELKETKDYGEEKSRWIRFIQY